MNKIYSTGIHRVFHSTVADYTSFSASHGPFSKIDHTQGHKAILKKYNKIEIITSILTEHNRIKLKSVTRKSTKIKFMKIEQHTFEKISGSLKKLGKKLRNT
jgi:hypothetical protein